MIVFIRKNIILRAFPKTDHKITRASKLTKTGHEQACYSKNTIKFLKRLISKSISALVS